MKHDKYRVTFTFDRLGRDKNRKYVYDLELEQAEDLVQVLSKAGFPGVAIERPMSGWEEVR